MTRSFDRRTLLRRGAAFALVATAGCASDGAGAVTMTDGFAFDPETVTVAPGTTVRWENASDVGHTVTAYADRIPSEAAYFASGGFDTERAARDDVNGGIVASGETYEHTFERAGTYAYFCVPHEGSGMTGTVRVG